MSAICGILRPGGAPVEALEIQTMLKALDYWQPDARGVWTDAAAGLGHLLLQTRHEGEREVMPLHEPAHHLAITGDIRLDNRADLAGRLGISAADLQDCPDGRLVLRAYREWGDACLAHLAGDFAFALWDGSRRQLFCARDAFGVKPFYYTVSGDALALSSEMKGLLALPWVDRAIDETWVADYLHHLRIDATHTFYAHIKRLPPAHALIMTASGIRLWRHWSPDLRHELRFAREEDYVEGFREKLVAAIRRRMDTPFEVGAELSGGLDSSGICAIAQQLLRADGRALVTFAQVQTEDAAMETGVPYDARWAVEQLRDHAGITRHHELTGEGGILPLVDWAARYYDEPPRDLVSLYNDQLYDAAAGQGVRVLLSGYGGNQGVSASGAGRRRELLRSGQWFELWRELGAGSDHPALGWLRMVLGEFQGPALEALRRKGLWRSPMRPTREDFARRIGMRRRTFMASAIHHAAHRGTLRDQTLRVLALPFVAFRLECAHAPTIARKIEYRYPLLDRELVEFYLATPSRFKYWRGTTRYLFRRSLEPWVPDKVRGAHTLASANPGIFRRRLFDQDELKARVQTLPARNAALRFVDLEKLSSQTRIAGRQRRERQSPLLMVLILEQKLAAAPTRQDP